eukprot:SAG11_NODE_289_length_11184_cov_20.648083_5_plen_111_part_00
MVNPGVFFAQYAWLESRVPIEADMSRSFEFTRYRSTAVQASTKITRSFSVIFTFLGKSHVHAEIMPCRSTSDTAHANLIPLRLFWRQECAGRIASQLNVWLARATWTRWL